MSTSYDIHTIGRGLRRGKKPRGRPHKYSGLTNHMRINDDLKEIIQCSQHIGETFNDTALRMFREKAEETKKAREENDRLRQELYECNKLRTTVEHDNVPEHP